MQLHFTKTNGPVDDAIDRLIKEAGDVQRPEIVREMVLAALLQARRTMNAPTSSS
jgi:hypothetical protein